MKIAVMSDIHGNETALKQCVEYAIERNVDAFIFLGDYVGELPCPRQVMEYLYELKRQYPCYMIRGNREGYFQEYQRCGETGWEKGNSCSGSLLYTYEQLRQKDLDFLFALPEKQNLCLDGYPSITLCHGSPERINEQMLKDSARTIEIMAQDCNSYILCGHTHLQGEICQGGKVLLNPGSVGLSQEAGGDAQFLILYGEHGEWNWEFVRLPYDVETVLAKLCKAGLPDYAPYWYQVTRHMLLGGMMDHGMVIARAKEINDQKFGPMKAIAEECWAQAVQELL